MGAFSWFQWKGFLILAVLIYVSFIVGDWLIAAVGLNQYGIVGTLIALALPVIVIYWAWKTQLKKHIR